MRDALLKRTLKDFDVATSAAPEAVESLFPKTILVGKQFGVIIVQIGSASIEVATFRTDGDYGDGRRPDKVNYGAPEGDALRRDFSVNGLFFDLETRSVVDFVGGLNDLKHKNLKTIGDPSLRFNEDKLRILRAIRFVAQLNFQLEKNTWAAIQENASNISGVSAERITGELQRMLEAPYSHLGVKLLVVSNLGKVLFPDVQERVWKDLALAHERLQTLNQSFLFVESLALVSFFQGRDFGAWGGRLRLAKSQVSAVKSLYEGLVHLTTQSKWIRSSLMMLLAGEKGLTLLHALRGLVLIQAHDLRSLEWYQAFREETLGESGMLPPAWFSGKDLLECGIPPGREMGELLANIYEDQLNGRWPGRDAALNWLKARGSHK